MNSGLDIVISRYLSADFLPCGARPHFIRQRPSDLQQTLEACQDHWPALGDAAVGNASLIEIVVRQGKLDDLAARLEFEGDARGALAPDFFRAAVPAIGKLPRRFRYQDFAIKALFAVEGELVT